MKIRMAMVLALLTAVIGSGLGLVYTKHQSRKLFIELQNLQVRKDALEVEWGQLQLEQSTLATEAVVDYSARTRLNMVIPESDAVVYVKR